MKLGEAFDRLTAKKVTAYVSRKYFLWDRLTTAALVVVAVLCCGGIAYPIVKSFVGELAMLVLLAVNLIVLGIGHGFTTWWLLTSDPRQPLSRWFIAHPPYLLMWAMTYLWWKHPWDGGAPSLWYLPWAGALLIGLSLVWLWWLDGDRSKPRRAIVLLTSMAVLIGGTTAGGFTIAWRSTGGFGLQGQPEPYQAIEALIAESCVFSDHGYRVGGEWRPADCPQDAHGPGADLGTWTTNSQPREALNHWWTYYQQFGYMPPLEYDWRIDIEDQGDGVAKAVITVTLPPAAAGQNLAQLEPDELWCTTSGRTETWQLQLEEVTFGGWKVARVDVANPITVVPFIGSPCDRPAP